MPPSWHRYTWWDVDALRNILPSDVGEQLGDRGAHGATVLVRYSGSQFKRTSMSRTAASMTAGTTSWPTRWRARQADCRALAARREFDAPRGLFER